MDITGETAVYRTVGEGDLSAHVFSPEAPGEWPAIVFFHGGGLTGGSPDYFLPECEYLASRGMVAATAEYRLLWAQAESALDCIEDAQAAIAWIRNRAGVDPRRIVAVGYSAGGFLAGSTALAAPVGDFGPSCRPDALVLLNAVVDSGWLQQPHSDRTPPPTLILHGRRDTMAPIGRARKFAKKVNAAGHSCQLVEFDGAHTFFRPYAKNGSAGFIGVLQAIDGFLTSLGYLSRDKSSDKRIEALGESMLADVLARRAKRTRA